MNRLAVTNFPVMPEGTANTSHSWGPQAVNKHLDYNTDHTGQWLFLMHLISTQEGLLFPEDAALSLHSNPNH